MNMEELYSIYLAYLKICIDLRLIEKGCCLFLNSFKVKVAYLNQNEQIKKNINQNYADFLNFNDTPNEKTGSNKVSCRTLKGKYTGYNNRQEEVISLFMKNGYLYCSAGGPT